MKQLARTPELIERLRASFGAEADIDNLVAYEAEAANTLPLRKSRGLYKGARFTVTAMHDMVALVAKESVALQTMHDTDGLPSGRVFAAKVVGETLYVQFAVNRQTKAALISDIDAGVIDQVSVGALPKSLLCSECNFDYLGDEASFDNLYFARCANDHEIGVNGVHARIVGCADFFEMSLVGKGAVDGARIRNPSQSVFASASAGAQRLAASGAAAALACDGITQHSPKESTAMDKDFLAQLTAATEAKVKAEMALAPLQASLDAANTELTALRAQVTELQSKVEKAPSQETVDAAVAALSAHAKKVAVAAGEPDAAIPTDVAALSAFIDERTAKLTAILPTEQRSEGAARGAEQPKARGAGHAFVAR